jgi:hypothetical protein
MERMRTQTIAKSQNNNDDLELYKPCSFGSYTAVKRTVEILRQVCWQIMSNIYVTCIYSGLNWYML